MPKIPIATLIAASLLIGPPAGAAEPAHWLPSAPWQLDAGESQCTLLRGFKSGEEEMLLQIQPNIYSTLHHFALTSKTALGNGRAEAIDFTLGDEDKKRPIYAWIETLVADGSPVLRWMTDDSLRFADIVRDDETIRIRSNWGFDAAIDLPGAKKAFAALRSCQDEVARDKGFDAVARRAYKRQVTPTGNPGRWVTNDDYPPIARERGREGTTGFRVTIDESGAITDCEISQSSGVPLLDSRTCELVRARGRFLPALDAAGNAVADTYSNRVRWQVPR